MGVKRVYWTWGLLLVAFIGIGISFFGNWYGMAADGDDDSAFANSRFFRDDARSGIEDPRQMIHTDFWTPAHIMQEGGAGRTADYEQVPFTAQVLGVLRIFYLIGLVGLVAASVGLLFRLRGLIDGKGVLATLAVFSILFMGFGVTYFSVNIAEAYNKQLDDDAGSSPELAFFTFGTDSEDGEWSNVTSAPGVGWWGAVVGVLASAGAFGFVFATDLRRAREVLIDDEAAAERYRAATEERRHVLDRIREGGRD